MREGKEWVKEREGVRDGRQRVAKEREGGVKEREGKGWVKEREGVREGRRGLGEGKGRSG